MIAMYLPVVEVFVPADVSSSSSLELPGYDELYEDLCNCHRLVYKVIGPDL